MTTNSPNTVDGDVLEELHIRYAEPKIPKCRICGGALSVQRAGGGGPTIWACSGMIDDPTGERNWIYAEGRSCADKHYERSRWTDYRRGGDSDVIDLIDAYQALLDERLNATAKPVSDAANDVIAERQRQVSQEGWTPEHDDNHSSGEMAGAAACYARHVNGRQWVYQSRPDDYSSEEAPESWPWDEAWWKPKSPRKDLVRAAALLIAEIERIDRLAAAPGGQDD